MSTRPRSDAFSAALHAWVLRELRRRPAEVLAHAQGRAAQHRATDASGHSAVLWDEWDRLLAEGQSAVEQVLISDEPDDRRLRQASPFTGLMTPAERWKIWRAVRDAA